MDSLLGITGNEVIDEQSAVSVGSIVAPFIEFVARLVLCESCRIDRSGVGIGTARSLTGNGIQLGKPGTIVISHLEVIGHRHTFGAPIGRHYPQLGKGAFQRHGLPEGLRHRNILGEEIGIAALVVQLSLRSILYCDTSEIGRIVMQVGRLALPHIVGPRHKLIGIVGSEPKFKSHRSIGVDRLNLRCDKLRRTVFRVDRHLITKIVFTPIHICQASIGTVGPRHGTCHLHHLGNFESQAYHIAMRIQPGFFRHFGTAGCQSQQCYSHQITTLVHNKILYND